MSYPIIEKFNRSLIDYGDDVVVALSGGADSVCLLYNMLSLWERGYIETLTAVHCNHGLRGEEADRDEKFCKDLCNKLKIHLYCEKIPVMEYAEEHSLSLEEAGRNLRYKTFEKYRMGGKIATAHNKKDNAETVIFNLIRGTSLAGMSGIPIMRDAIIRPLLDVSRDEIEEYLKEIGAEYVTDHTNLETKYSRNKIRLSIIPEMENINEGAVNNITAFAKLASYDEEFLSSLADDYLSMLHHGENELDLIIENEDKTSAEDIPYAILSRVIKKFLTENGFSADRHRIDTIMDYCNDGDGFLNLSPTATLEVRGYRIIINQKEKTPFTFEIRLSEGENFVPHKKVTLIYHDIEDAVELVNKKFTNHILDCDKILGTVLTARNRRNSDRIQLVGRDFQHRIKKLYENISADEKDRKILIADEGDIIFAEDFGVSERVKVTEETKRILEIRIEEL
ncbi:MAG: tRNA lysidine(34) synthetase TilS [Oscillospiraceae bacterium]|nr:tRNA lysidine(34) synthetase TilS [Oscillospiraceae bacterium]